jgi:hypothetical protein
MNEKHCNTPKMPIFSDEFASQKNAGKNYEFTAGNMNEEQNAEEKAVMALVNRFPNRITMFGYRVKSDEPAQPTDRKQMDLHPYTRYRCVMYCSLY